MDFLEPPGQTDTDNMDFPLFGIPRRIENHPISMAHPLHMHGLVQPHRTPGKTMGMAHCDSP
eukprot:15361977-Ditylum_brightwellii.AAC.1